ncbi:galactokinase [Streptomyces sp. PKU-EA00015]|uniref:galactokinase n=1 Tax=Streptomyces sp. PKU-EA00015 TaxID=2748326 RepID=UPI0015A255C6|nr:galactokinase [Streptomyces sp. PKU-EA00015]NWF28086.1 galactokinase [Streptomyces sp. PKU-EA00015]
MSDGVWAAPGRVNLIGEHTDYNDGFVMPFALPHTTVATVARRDDGVLRLHSADVAGDPVELRVDDLAPAARSGDWTDYPAGVVWALRWAGLAVGGADIHFESTVPTGAGLSSSAAIEVATALALNDLYALGMDSRDIARMCRRAENVYVGAPTGIMDQMASACCVEGNALHLDTRDLALRQIPFDLRAHGLELLVVDTRVKHAHSEGEYGKRRAGCEAGAAALGVDALRDVPFDGLDDALALLDDPEVRALVRHIVTENHRVERVMAHLEAGEVRAIGPVLTEGHASLRDDFRVSCPELDLVVDTALTAGALGARMTGGGFGGSAIVLVESSSAHLVAKSVQEAFAARSLDGPRVFTAVPSVGARRVS